MKSQKTKIKYYSFLAYTFILLMSGVASAQKNYYLSSSNGNDENKGTENAPWKSLQKISKTKLHPGDKIAFKKGDVFIGHFDINGSGSAKHPILITSYGKGAQPILSGQVGVQGGGGGLRRSYFSAQSRAYSFF